jgi:hypothetical protein
LYQRDSFNPDNWHFKFSQVIIPSRLVAVFPDTVESAEFKSEIANIGVKRVIGSEIPPLPAIPLDLDDPLAGKTAVRVVKESLARDGASAIFFPDNPCHWRSVAIIHLSSEWHFLPEDTLSWLQLTSNLPRDLTLDKQAMELCRLLMPCSRRVTEAVTKKRHRPQTMAPGALQPREQPRKSVALKIARRSHRIVSESYPGPGHFATPALTLAGSSIPSYLEDA